MLHARPMVQSVLMEHLLRMNDGAGVADGAREANGAVGAHRALAAYGGIAHNR